MMLFFTIYCLITGETVSLLVKIIIRLIINHHQLLALESNLFLCVVDLQEQLQRAMMLDQERRRAEDEAARLEAERQAALLAKEELARQAEDQKKSQEQLVSVFIFFLKSKNQILF